MIVKSVFFFKSEFALECDFYNVADDVKKRIKVGQPYVTANITYDCKIFFF